MGWYRNRWWGPVNLACYFSSCCIAHSLTSYCSVTFSLGSQPHIFTIMLLSQWASLVAQTVKHLPCSAEDRVQFLGWEDPLEKEMATHCNTPAWKIPWMEEALANYNPWGRKESDMTEWLHFLFFLSSTFSVGAFSNYLLVIALFSLLFSTFCCPIGLKVIK